MLSAARLTGQTLGAAAVAILFRAYGTAAPKFALWTAAVLALAAAVVSTARLTATPARS
jgi:DHA2 family multidrug resistance protein-like MFS transporter